MIRCEICGEEFSYGRKISCCKSIHFGIIFSAYKKDHKWNCNPEIIKMEYSDIYPREIIKVIIDNTPISYDWNCETSKRFNLQENIEMRDHIIFYE